jgi:hypothetical protein
MQVPNYAGHDSIQFYEVTNKKVPNKADTQVTKIDATRIGCNNRKRMASPYRRLVRENDQ